MHFSNQSRVFNQNLIKDITSQTIDSGETFNQTKDDTNQLFTYLRLQMDIKRL